MNITELLEQHNIPYKVNGKHHHARAGWVQVDCPFCSQAGGFHMGLALAKPRASCWRCGSRRLGEVLWLISKKKISLNRCGVQYAYKEDTKPQGHYVPPPGLGPLTDIHKGYLLKRGFDVDTVAALWHVEGIPWYPSRMMWRLFIPVYLDGVPVSWTTRSIAQDPGLRYVSAAEHEEAVPHRSLLYGEEHCDQTVIVTEGPLDVWAIGPGAVCTFGTAFTAAQINRLARYSRRILCYDTEENRAGDKAVAQLGAVLSMMPGTTEIIKLSTGSDPAAAKCGELRELRTYAFGADYGIGKLEYLCS